MAGGAADRAGPLAVDLDQPEARGLQPAQDPLGLLGGGRRRGTGTAADRLAAGDELGDVVVGVGAGRDDPAAASRPWRTTCTAQRRRRAGRPRGGRRPAGGCGSGPSAAGCGRPRGRRPPAGRGGPRPPRSARRRRATAIRRVISSTTSSGRRRRLSRSCRTTAAYVVSSTLPSHGDRQRPISASTHAEPDGLRGRCAGSTGAPGRSRGGRPGTSRRCFLLANGPT